MWQIEEKICKPFQIMLNDFVIHILNIHADLVILTIRMRPRQISEHAR